MDNLSGLKTIGQNAFSGFSGGDVHYMTITINELPSGLTYLGGMAFYLGGPNVYVSKIPSGLTSLEGQVFAFCPNVRIGSFGDSSGIGLNKIGSQALFNAGVSGFGDADYDKIDIVENLFFHKSVTTVGASGVLGGGSYANTVLNFHFALNAQDYELENQTDRLDSYEALLQFMGIEFDSATITIKGPGEW